MKSYKELNETIKSKSSKEIQLINEELSEMGEVPMPQDYEYPKMDSEERKSIFDRLEVTDGTKQAIIELIKSFEEEGDLYLGQPYLRKNDFGLVISFRKEETSNIILSSSEFWSIADTLEDRLGYVAMRYESLIIGIDNL